MNQAARLNALLPEAKIYFYEASEEPNYDVLHKAAHQFHTYTVFVSPTAKFGSVRARVMKERSADFIAMIDDDVILSRDWFEVLLEELENPDVVAAGSLVTYLDDKGILRKLSDKAALRFSGGSGGASIYKRKEILALGNFNEKIHRGEDMELKLRVDAAGKKWITCRKTQCFHPMKNVLQFLEKPKANVIGWDFVMQHSGHKFRFMAERFGSTLVMPIYYLFSTKDARCAAVWAVYKWKSLLYYLSKRYLNWS